MDKPYTAPHTCVYRSLFGEQYESFGVLRCWCDAPLIYERPRTEELSCLSISQKIRLRLHSGATSALKRQCTG